MVMRHETAIALVESTFKNYDEQIAYSCMGREMSFSELDKLSMQFAKFLHHKLGMKPGDRLAIQVPNLLQFPVVTYGAIRAGLILVNLNPLFTEREIKYQLKDSGATALVVLSNVAKNASNIIKDTSVKHVIVTDVGDLLSFPKRVIVNFVLRYIKKAIPAFSFEKTMWFRDTLEEVLPELPEIKITGDDILLLQYTGGTTGVAKAAMLTHANIAINVWQLIAHLPEVFDTQPKYYITCLPLYHIYALNLNGMCAFSAGGHNVLVPNARDLDSIVKTMKKYPINVFTGVNTLFNALCRKKNFQRLDFSKLEVTAAGGMALTPEISKIWYETTGCGICEGYGLTETSPTIAGNQPNNIHHGTIGKLVPETEFKIIDDDGNEVEHGERGELCLRGPQIMKGYWNQEEETKLVLSDDGWFKTGDIAQLDDQGYIQIVDRKKDMILVSGFNVYPNEVEDVVLQMPDVVEAAAIGVPDSYSGEKVKLFIVPATPELTEQEVRAYCKSNLTGYKVPKIIDFRESLPKSNVGKILRKELRGL